MKTHWRKTAQPSTRISLLQLAVLLITLAVVLGGVAIVGVWMLKSTLSTEPPAAVNTECPPSRDCVSMSLAEVSGYTGYSFPDGSAVDWVYEDTSWFDNSWKLKAHVTMPAGSAIPELPDGSSDLSSISVKDISSSGTTVEVSVLTLNGKP